MDETKTRTRGSSQVERRNLSERRLIEAALSIAVEAGISAVTFEAIGAEAGYSRGLASQKFGSKQGLIRAVIDHLHQNQAGARDEYAAQNLNGFANLLAMAKRHFDRLMNSKSSLAYFVFFAGTVGELSEMRVLFAESHERWKGEIAELIARGQSDGSVRTQIDPEAAALMVGSLLLGVAVQYIADPGMDLQRVEAETIHMLRATFSTEVMDSH